MLNSFCFPLVSDDCSHELSRQILLLSRAIARESSRFGAPTITISSNVDQYLFQFSFIEIIETTNSLNKRRLVYIQQCKTNTTETNDESLLGLPDLLSTTAKAKGKTMNWCTMIANRQPCRWNHERYPFLLQKTISIRHITEQPRRWWTKMSNRPRINEGLPFLQEAKETTRWELYWFRFPSCKTILKSFPFFPIMFSFLLFCNRRSRSLWANRSRPPNRSRLPPIKVSHVMSLF